MRTGVNLVVGFSFVSRLKRRSENKQREINGFCVSDIEVALRSTLTRTLSVYTPLDS